MIFTIVLIILFLDQLTKFIVAKNLVLNQSLPVIKGIFHISLIHNRGAAFGILKDQVPVFIVTAIFAIILICLNFKIFLPSLVGSDHPSGKNKKRDSPKGRLYNISLGLILAGAFGNLIDRLVFGYVIDFLDFRIWPVFNIADSAITVGTVLLGWLILRLPEVNRC